MQYLIKFDSEEAAKEKNIEIARNNGCDGNLTNEFSTIIKHPLRDEWAIQVPEAFASCLTAEEQVSLITEEVLDNDGWFSEIVV